MKKFCLIISLSICTRALFSQVLYGGMQQLSINYSQNGTNPGFMFVNGVRFARFFTGVGADLQFRSRNYYYANSFNSTAFFADTRYYINQQKNFFCKADLGVNLILQQSPDSPRYNYDKKAGYYGTIGIGYKARLGKEVFYSFDLSYSMKQTRYSQTYTPFISSESSTEKVDFRRNSVVLCLGLEIK